MTKSLGRAAVFVVVMTAFAFLISPCFADDDSLISRDIEAVKKDYRNFYANGENLLRLGIGVGVAGIFANSSMDKEIQKYYQDSVRSETTDSAAKALKWPGNAVFILPILLGTHVLLEEHPAGQWAQKSLRAIMVGAPAGLFLQRMTGASDPSEGESKWRPLKDSNGLSGHAFLGAVPFITAAKMNDNTYVKSILYALSVLPGLTRINDNKHYFSQAVLGWYLAYLSCNTVEKSEEKEKISLNFVPLKGIGGGILMSYRF
ncbi:MAG: hypothetical protein A2X54_09550 [Nitrospirae bacterium GWF2_44_13]|nr:MAG: hypothetical protein A2X54_09550 [Nitrospirae bacterium GWF2_44_13]OGW32588.1 MAG: hypothetical protein A2088_02470 [Nitrospirae bacterium GWD2_44_7]OGW63494.1 MAG: hypothetical protein A2222_06670 [Nitrospirae bacterium RIFOXYA2_FULL_44_9]OGW73269.1 MAG: hypothetical protein A2484_00250 [Nitrospirae bacterium RIFOXYC2_FULL_44_7]